MSHSTVKDLQSEHKCVTTDKMMDHLIRETLQRATRPGENAPTTDKSTLTNQSHAGLQPDNDSKGQLAPVDAEIGMKKVPNMEQENVKENSAEAHDEKRNDIEFRWRPSPWWRRGLERRLRSLRITRL
jgi:hypothetical protein